MSNFATGHKASRSLSPLLRTLTLLQAALMPGSTNKETQLGDSLYLLRRLCSGSSENKYMTAWYEVVFNNISTKQTLMLPSRQVMMMQLTIVIITMVTMVTLKTMMTMMCLLGSEQTNTWRYLANKNNSPSQLSVDSDYLSSARTHQPSQQPLTEANVWVVQS